MRVLQIIDNMNRGGAQAFIINIYREIERSEVQFDFLLHTDKECSFNEEIRALGGKLYAVPPRHQGILKNRKALEEFFKTHPDYKIVHHHVSSLTYVEPLKVAKRYGVPMRIIHSHNTRQGGSFLHQYLHRWNQLAVKSYATHYLACSDLAAKWLYGKRQYGSGDFAIINNGIEIEKFIYNAEIRSKIRAELGVGDQLVLGNVGRFSYQKNHDFLIDIFKSVHEKETNSVLLLVGDGELRGQIEQKIAAYGLQDSVILTGVRSDIPDLLQAMDVLVMPSYYEGLPVTLVEAQAAGLPCVVADNITQQIKITNFIEYIGLDLSDAASAWSSSIIRLVALHVRKDVSDQIIEAGFDIKNTAQYLQKVYLL